MDEGLLLSGLTRRSSLLEPAIISHKTTATRRKCYMSGLLAFLREVGGETAD